MSLNHKPILFFLGLVFLVSSSLSAQTDTAFLSRAIISLENYNSSNTTEKVYLHMDKCNYDLGDTVWYKAYVVVGAHHQLSALSGVAYIELVGSADTVVSRQILRVTNGVAFGGLALPDKTKPGDYEVHAYTNWMRHAGQEYFFNQKIHVGGYETKAVIKTTSGKPDVQFFPEGGWLVNGLRSKVAVKVLNASGYGQNIKGTVEDDKGNVIVDFATQHLGMGIFAFTPQRGRTYKAKISMGETSFFTPLPLAKEEGYTLGINNSSPDSIFIKVAVNEPLFRQKQHSRFYIVAQTAGRIYYTSAGTLDDMTFTSPVDKKRFPSGIVQFTLFGENGEPLNERIAFIQSNDTLQLHIGAPDAAVIRQKVKIDLDAKAVSNKPVKGTFSVAVINENVTGEDELSESNILSNLLITSDLKGYIEQPNYYFINPNNQTRADLDVLMLTQGYQRYQWKAILNNTSPAITYQPEKELELQGSITTPSGKPVPNGKVTLMSTEHKLFADTLTDANGNFKFTGLDLPDSARVILSAKKTNNNNNVDIIIKRTEYPPVVKQNIASYSSGPLPDSINSKTTVTNTFRQQRLDFLNRKHQLKEVVIKSTRFKRAEPDLSNSANLNGPGRADQIIKSDDLKDIATLYDGLYGRLRDVDLYIDRLGFVTAYNRRVHGMHKPSKMVLVIDGNISPSVSLNDINPNIVHSIEVLTSPKNLLIYGYDVGGAILITTKHSGDKDWDDIPTAPGTLKHIFKGFYVTREFYSPRYDTPKSNTPLPDLRSTIYWNPNLITDEPGKASVEFFNSDTKGTYRIVIEGIDGDGNLGRQVYRYKVE
jgi:hypothetical protein